MAVSNTHVRPPEHITTEEEAVAAVAELAACYGVSAEGLLRAIRAGVHEPRSPLFRRLHEILAERKEEIP